MVLPVFMMAGAWWLPPALQLVCEMDSYENLILGKSLICCNLSKLTLLREMQMIFVII